MAIDQYSRVVHKRTQVSGATPTIGPSDDHTDGSWTNTDIYPGEFFLDMGGQVGWFGYSGTTSGVGVWMSGDTSVGSVVGDEYLTTTQVGGNIIIDYTGTDVGGGWQYKKFDFTIPAGSNVFVTTNNFTMNLDIPTCVIAEMRIILIDTITYDSTFFIANQDVIGALPTKFGIYYNVAFPVWEEILGDYIGSLGNAYFENDIASLDTIDVINNNSYPGLEIGFRVTTNFPFPNDINGRAILKYRATPL